jgi:sulfate transport system ATP-binding protein/putative spermidine/putrescine transport system ATP-binding protein
MAWIENLDYRLLDFQLNIPRWDFPDSGITCIFGESGSGKTTLLQIMAGLLPCPHKLCVAGEMVSELPPKEKNIGFVFQDFALFPHMTTFENLKFAAQAKNLPPEVWIPHVEKLLSRLDIERIRDQKAKTLSGGEQQRVALARALVTKPRLVLLDEPLSSLDEVRKEEARNLIRDLSNEFRVPFVLVTHDLRDVRILSQNLIFLQNGKILGFGKTEDLLNKPQDLELARAVPENQVIGVKIKGNLVELGSKQFTPQIILNHPGSEDLLVFKPWSFIISEKISQNDMQGTVVNVFNEGPHLGCLVRLSSGQIIKAVAPVGSAPKDQVELSLNLNSVILYKGRN